METESLLPEGRALENMRTQQRHAAGQGQLHVIGYFVVLLPTAGRLCSA